jgi:wyosine [tRNA(Phe)-imidazoG37] synthetase (radical SAM superfamily)
MSAALRLYEQLTEAKDDKTRARLIAEAFDELETRFPQLADLATQGHVRESELRLQKEIELVRKEIKEVEGRLLKEIKELEGRLLKEIAQIRVEAKALEVRLTQSIHRQTLWIVGSVGAIVGLVRVLDALIK